MFYTSHLLRIGNTPAKKIQEWTSELAIDSKALLQ